MPRPLRGFFLALACVWAILLIAAYFYSQDQNIPRWISAAVVPAFLAEAGLYLAAGTEAVRTRLERLRPVVLASWMTAAGPVPYLVYSLGTGLFDWRSLAAVTAIAAGVSFWYVVLPRRAGFDLLLMAALAACVLAKVFARMYPEPLRHVEVSVLGYAMLVRTGIVAVLSLRRLEGVGFGFLPRPREWVIGAIAYVIFLAIGIPLAAATGFAHLGSNPLSARMILLAIATFFGMLWVVAVAEEFFFRGILQQQLGRISGSPWAGWLLASVLFGAAHLPFRGFPNYRFAVLAALAGASYGLAYMRARSIRAAMVAHALVATTWKVFT